MLLRQMKLFVAVVENQSFSEAAEQCFISQSAISQQIKALEDELGIQLLQRNNRRFTMTPAGEYFYQNSKKIIQDTEQLRQKLKEISTYQKKVFKIGCLRGYNVLNLCTAVNKLLSEHPDFNIDIYYGDHDKLLEKLRNHELDIVFNDLRNKTELISFSNKLLEDVPLLVAVPNRHPYTEKNSLESEDLNKMACILLTSKESEESERSFYSQLYNFQGAFLNADSPSAAITMVINNKGFLPNYCNSDGEELYGSLTRLLPVMLNGSPITNKYYIFWNPENESTTFNNLVNMILHYSHASSITD